MFDSAALGTAIIGLAHLRREEERYARGTPMPGRERRHRRHLRRRVGDSLRRAADILDPTPALAR